MEGIQTKPNFCQICSLQFDGTFIYNRHMSVLHKNLESQPQSISDEIEKENDFSTQPIKEETDTSIQDNILRTAKNSSLSNKVITFHVSSDFNNRKYALYAYST